MHLQTQYFKMSDYIPFDIQTKIMKCLPVKSLIRFQTVSKQWSSLIHSSKFINEHQKIHKTKSQHRLLVQYELDTDFKSISIVDDDTFPHHKSSLAIPQPLSMLPPISELTPVSLFTSDNGVLCFTYNDYSSKTMMAVLWNPTVTKSVGINIPNVLDTEGSTYIGFGVCSNTGDIKLVRINCIDGGDDSSTVDWEAKVFTLSTHVWKSVSNIPRAFKTYCLTYGHVSVEGFIYWNAYDSEKYCYKNMSNLIVSFDLKSDEFGEVCLPDSLVEADNISAFKFKESLGLIDRYFNDSGIPFCDVWILKEGVTKSFSKMFSMKMRPDPTNSLDTRIVGFRKNGEAVMEIETDGGPSVLEVYDPSGPYNGIGISGDAGSFSVKSYVETLLLLGESSSIIQ